jgi:glycogen(starch) synthase
LKILIVINLYPPHYFGGYEVRCSQVAEFLQKAGHEVRVLTSSYRLPNYDETARSHEQERVGGVSVERSLCYFRVNPPPSGYSYTLSMAKRQMADARRFIQILDAFRPDIVNWWNLEGITKAILRIPASRSIPDIHWVEDDALIREYGVHGEREHLSWFNFWRAAWGPWIVRPLLRQVLAPWEKRVQCRGIPTRPFANQPTHVCFVSEFMRFQHCQAGLNFPSWEVIYGGVAREQFYAQRTRGDFQKGRLRFLYASQIYPSRGLRTVVEALGLLPETIREKLELSIVGSGPAEGDTYLEAVTTRIKDLGLSKTITFLGKIPHENMSHLYREHHVLIFPSIREEGLPLTIIEAMCAGCAVITTGSGGAIEIADIADLPIFPKDHPLALSRLIAKLVNDREVVYQTAKRGQEVALREFSFARMTKLLCDRFQILHEGRKEAIRYNTINDNLAVQTVANI